MAVTKNQEFPSDEYPEGKMAETMWSVFTQIEHIVNAVDGQDAIQQVAAELAKSRSQRYTLEIQLSINAKPVRPAQ